MSTEGAPGRGAPAPGGTPAPGGAPGSQGARVLYRLPSWLFPLGLVTALEPPVLIVVYFVNMDLAGGHLLAYAIVGGLFISLPSLAILGLAVIWHRRLTTVSGEIPGVPPSLTGPTASRISAIALVVSTVLFGLVLALLLGAWALLAAPPLALSLASAWLMGDAARSRAAAPGR